MYGIAKAGTVQLTRAFAMTYARDNIRCVGIAPGSFPHFQDPNAETNRGDARTTRTLPGTAGHYADLFR